MYDDEADFAHDPQDELSKPLINTNSKISDQAMVEKKVDEAPKIEILAPDAKQKSFAAPEDEPSVGKPVDWGAPEQTA